MNTVRNIIAGGILWTSLALSNPVTNAQDQTNHAVTNTINGVNQNGLDMEMRMILQNQFRKENGRSWEFNNTSMHDKMTSNFMYDKFTWWMHKTPESRKIQKCEELESPIDTSRYSERRTTLAGYIDCLYENEIAKWRTPHDILTSAYSSENRTVISSTNIMRNLANKSISEIHNIYFHNPHSHIVWKWYRDLLIKKWALLNPGSKAYRWLSGE